MSNRAGAKDLPSSRNCCIIRVRLKKRLRVDTVLVGAILVVIWSLLLLPIIFYHVPAVCSVKKQCSLKVAT